MGRNRKKNEDGKHCIADEIRAQIGKSVLIVFVLVEIVTIIMVWLATTSFRKSELTLESESAANQLAGFFEKYAREAEVLALNPQIRAVLQETKAGDNILDASDMDTVNKYLVNTAAADANNIMAAWIADLDASMITQSDGFTSTDGWDITGRAWYTCIETGETVLTEPYVDSSTGLTILSAVSPVYDENGTVLGAAGLDISMEHVTEVMSGYKIGTTGYVLLVSASGTLLYHPQTDLIQQNIADVGVSDNVVTAIANQENQSLKYRVNGQTKYGRVQEAGETGYIVISSMKFLEYYFILIEIIAALAVLFAIGVIVVMRSIRKI